MTTSKESASILGGVLCFEDGQGGHTCVARLIGPESQGAGEKIVRAVNARVELVSALRGMVEAFSIRGLKIQKDFSKLNAYAYAVKVLGQAGGRQ